MGRRNSLGGDPMLLMFVKIILLNVIPLAEGFLLGVLLREQYRYRLAGIGKKRTIAAPLPSTADEPKDTEPFEPLKVSPAEVSSQKSATQPSKEPTEAEQPQEQESPNYSENPNSAAQTVEDEPISPTSSASPAHGEAVDFSDMPSSFKIDHLLDGGLDENQPETESEDFSFPMDESDTFQNDGMDDSFASEEDDILARAMIHDTDPPRQVDFETELPSSDSERSAEHKDGVSPLAVELLGEGFDFDAVLNPQPQAEEEPLYEKKEHPQNEAPSQAEEQSSNEDPNDSATDVNDIEEGFQFQTVLDPSEPATTEPRLTELENDAYRIESDFPIDSVALRNTTSFCNIQPTYPSGSVETFSVCPNPLTWNPDSVSVADTPPMLPRKSKRRL